MQPLPPLRERLDALFVAADGFVSRRRARERIPAAYVDRETVAAGGLMSYGTDNLDQSRQVGVYTGNILKGAKPAELPVVQPTRFEFVINWERRGALGIKVPHSHIDTRLLIARRIDDRRREIVGLICNRTQSRVVAVCCSFTLAPRCQLVRLHRRTGAKAAAAGRSKGSPCGPSRRFYNSTQVRCWSNPT